MQVVPSGPGESEDGLLQMLLAVINSAREELVLTTPYFVPDDSMLRALRGAAARGVRVDMILPERVDSLLTRYASRSYYDELLDLGVRIQLYQKGLLHTKSITADRRISMFGTVNLDMRSLWLNYEVALFVYGQRSPSSFTPCSNRICRTAGSWMPANGRGDRVCSGFWKTRSAWWGRCCKPYRPYFVWPFLSPSLDVLSVHHFFQRAICSTVGTVVPSLDCATSRPTTRGKLARAAWLTVAFESSNRRMRTAVCRWSPSSPSSLRESAADAEVA